MSLDFYLEDYEKQSSGSPCYAMDMMFLVRRYGSKSSKMQMEEIKEKLYGPYPNPKDVDDNEIIANWLAFYGVAGWEGVRADEDGELIEYSPASAIQLILTKGYWQSLDTVLFVHANNHENYLALKAEGEAEEIKKL